MHPRSGVVQANPTSASNQAQANEDSPTHRGEPPQQRCVKLEIESLVLNGSPRLAGESEAHVQILAEVNAVLPPILVHRETMHVIDGVHRVRAARLRGETVIEAVLVDGDAEASFVDAVKANISHGLPLTLADRRAAAKRLLSSYPEWSDRAIAAVSGLSAATVGVIRNRTTEAGGHLNVRVGKDGRARPLDAADGRRRAADIIAHQPNASLREIASAAGVSVGTARDVRKRIHNGEDAAPNGVRRPNTNQKTARQESFRSPTPDCHPLSKEFPHGSRTPSSILKILRKDPALRYSENGRSLLRWLGAHFVDSERCARIADDVPLHCTYSIIEVSMAYAEAWRSFANKLARRARHAAPR